MPTYEYECRICGYSFDAFQSFSDAPLKDCPQCGREIRRVINGGSGVIFKGSGFYVTDKKNSAAGSSKKTAGSGAETPKTEGASCPGCAAADTASCPKAANS